MKAKIVFFLLIDLMEWKHN